jgi:hypothetical protein
METCTRWSRYRTSSRRNSHSPDNRWSSSRCTRQSLSVTHPRGRSGRCPGRDRRRREAEGQRLPEAAAVQRPPEAAAVQRPPEAAEGQRRREAGA